MLFRSSPFSFPLSTVPEEAKREALGCSSFSAAGDWGSPPLRSSLRRREGGGTLDLPVWRVNSRTRCGSGVVLMVVAAACSIRLLELQPHLGVAGGDDEELFGGRFLGAVGGTVAAAAFVDFGPPTPSPSRRWLLRRRRGVVEVGFGAAGEKIWSASCRSLWLRPSCCGFWACLLLAWCCDLRRAR